MLKIAQFLKENTSINIKSTLLAAHVIPPEYHMRDGKYVDLVIEDIIPIIAKIILPILMMYGAKRQFQENKHRRYSNW